MSHEHFTEPFPKGALWGAAALIAAAIALTVVARERGAMRVERPESTMIEVVDVRFEDRDDGAIVAFRMGAPESPREIGRFAPGTSGFVRGVLRGLARERKLESLDDAGAFRLTRWADGRLSIEDPRTGRYVELGAFGADNSAAFAQLLPSGGAP